MPRPIVSISKSFTFDSSHMLEKAPDGHKCKRLHGHTYKVEVECKGPVDPNFGWLVDYDYLSDMVKPVIAQLDHYHLNDIEDLEWTTTEEIAVWFWKHLKSKIPSLYRISIFETPDNRCDFFGEYESGRS
ncbi:MAG: 6-carboxytetrahydropterin synthase QueD [Candidatus Electryonea clarkiae]|nr:6-carboxytetrahydropterin synthase QueD [Candidatus Electryonea clarkiae]MDP8285269.1 6-carboxytetrahydropterin synthase QueD [Candidatus Electryonea clarkiae]